MSNPQGKQVVSQSFTFESVPVAQPTSRGVVGVPASTKKKPGTTTHQQQNATPTHYSPPLSSSGRTSRNPQSRRYQDDASSPTQSDSDPSGPSESEVRALLLQASKMRDSLHSAVMGSRGDSLPTSPPASTTHIHNTQSTVPTTLTPTHQPPSVTHSDPQPAQTSSRRASQAAIVEVDEVVSITEDDLSKINDPDTLAFLEANSGWLVRYMHQGGAISSSPQLDQQHPISDTQPTSDEANTTNDDSSGAFFLTAMGSDGKEYHVCMHDDNAAPDNVEEVSDVVGGDASRAPSVAGSIAPSVASSRRQLQIPLGLLPPDIHKKHPTLFSDPSRYHRRHSITSQSVRSSTMSLASVQPAGVHPPDSSDDSVMFGDLSEDDHGMLEQELADVNAALYGTLLLRREQDYSELPDTPEAMLEMLEAQTIQDENIPQTQAATSPTPNDNNEKVDHQEQPDREDRTAIASVLDSYAVLDHHEEEDDDDDISSVAASDTMSAASSRMSSKSLRNRESLKARREKISNLLDLLQDRNKKARENAQSGTPRAAVDQDSAIQKLIGQTFVTQLGGGVGESQDLNMSMNSLGGSSSASSALSYASSGGVTDEQLDELRSVGEEAFARRLDILRHKHAAKRQKELDEVNKEWLRQQREMDPTLPDEDDPTATTDKRETSTPPAQGQPATNRSAFSVQHCGRRTVAPAPPVTGTTSTSQPPSQSVQEGIDRAAARAQGKKLTDSESRRVEFLLEAYGNDSDDWYETPEQKAKREAEEAATKAKMAEVESSLKKMQAIRDRVLRLRDGGVGRDPDPVRDDAHQHSSVRALNIAMGVSDSVKHLLQSLDADEKEDEQRHRSKGQLNATTTSATTSTNSDGVAVVVDQRKVLGNKYLADVAEEKKRKARLKALNDELFQIQQSVSTLTTAPYSFLKASHADPALLYGASRDVSGPPSAGGGMPEALPEGICLPDEGSIQALLASARQEDALWCPPTDKNTADVSNAESDAAAPNQLSVGEDAYPVVTTVPYVPSVYQESLRDRLKQASAAAEECAKISEEYLQKYELENEEDLDDTTDL